MEIILVQVKISRLAGKMNTISSEYKCIEVYMKQSDRYTQQKAARQTAKRNQKARKRARARARRDKKAIDEAGWIGHWACGRKRALARRQAERMAERYTKRRGYKIYTYRCHYCGKWHLTKRPPKDEQTHE